MNCLPLLELERFAEALVDGLKAELFLTPKPGLVDLSDNGSHADLNLGLMLSSIRLLRTYLDELAVALYRQRPLAELQLIGVAAERRMLKQLGCNGHRGGIFLTGLLLSAYARSGSSEPQALSRAVALQAQSFFQLAELPDSHGQQARERYQSGGIVSEALRGLPGLFEIALPAMTACGVDFETGAYLAMSRLMMGCEDTTCLHRGGQTGLARLRKAGAALEQCLLAGEDPQPLLRRLNRDFRRRNLTMGGVADLLGLAFGYLSFAGMGQVAAEQRSGRSERLSYPSVQSAL